MRYSEEQLSSMAEEINLVEYIGQTEDLIRKGQNYFINCPFHTGDDTPSLCIYEETQSWYCFGCHRSGNIFNWIMEKDGINFGEAIQKVVDITGTDFEPYEESKSVSVYKELHKASEDDELMDRQELDWEKDYLEKYSDDLPAEWLAEDMTEEALKVYDIRIDYNANRIVYPVFDQNGKFIGVKGRTRLDVYKELGLSKYINYQKIGTIDYFQGWTKIIPGKSIIIFEGIKSCIKAWGWGFRNMVAAETSAISEGQLRILIKYHFYEVIFAFDCDKTVKSLASDKRIQMLKQFTKVTAIHDTHGFLGEKDAPVDKGEQIFRQLLDERIRL